MENEKEKNGAFTKANLPLNEDKVSITKREAVEYRDYKRQKKRAEILAAIASSEGVLGDLEDARRVGERAARLRQVAVRLTPARIEDAGEYFLRNAVAMDCVIGGNGDTLSKVKAYEARAAARLRVRELTLVVSPFLIANCRYAEIRKEIKRVRKAARRAVLKVWVDKNYEKETLTRVARIACETGAQYFCVPYFEGCERLRNELVGGCRLQVSEVETLEDFRKLTNMGVGRVVTSRGWEIFSEWMKEVEKIDFPELSGKPKPQEEKKEVRALLPLPVKEEKSDETDYRCRLEGKDLKFL